MRHLGNSAYGRKSIPSKGILMRIWNTTGDRILYAYEKTGEK